ncbi:MAG: biopolymer transporter ExbD [Gammaproteobacteria bacterium]|nr:biopolymer transporter ExbD [Gammaproteobacteria bacterium]
MARKRHHYKRRGGNTYEIDVTTFLNLMVVLVPFLLITAVFSRLTIVELNLPSGTGSSSEVENSFRVEVIVRDTGIEIGNGTDIIAAIPKKEGEYDFESLSDVMLELKRGYPDREEASVLMESQIPYDYLIQAMDTVRSVELPTDVDNEFELFALFTEISVGDAP